MGEKGGEDDGQVERKTAQMVIGNFGRDRIGLGGIFDLVCMELVILVLARRVSGLYPLIWSVGMGRVARAAVFAGVCSADSRRTA